MNVVRGKGEDELRADLPEFLPGDVRERPLHRQCERLVPGPARDARVEDDGAAAGRAGVAHKREAPRIADSPDPMTATGRGPRLGRRVVRETRRRAGPDRRDRASVVDQLDGRQSLA